MVAPDMDRRCYVTSERTQTLPTPTEHYTIVPVRGIRCMVNVILHHYAMIYREISTDEEALS